MTKNFKTVISVLLAVLLVFTSAVCGVAVNDTADVTDGTVIESTEGSEVTEETTEPSTEETTEPSTEETTEPSEETTTEAVEETTTEAPAEEETTTEVAPSEEETTAPTEEESTTEATEEESTTEAPSEEETTAPTEEESTTEATEEETTTEVAPSEEETTAPTEEETTTEAPAEEETTTEVAPSEEETTAPAEEESTTEAPVEEETTTEVAPSEEDTTDAPADEETTETPSEEETTEPSEEESTTAPSEEETTTTPSEEETTGPSEEDTTDEPTTEDPTEPSQPEDPTEPSQPEDPTEPSQPEDPTEPSQPEDPTEPSQPEDPTEPSQPEDPTEPSQPEDPTDPSEPEDPTEPSEPEEPAEPKVPANVDLTLTSGKNGVTIKWTDAFDFLGDDYAYGVGYRIYRKTADGSWKKIATVADVVEYTDAAAVYGVTYYYVIRAFYNTEEGEMIIGGYDNNGFEIATNYVITPAITETSLQKDKYIKVVWTSIPGATKYALYRATSPDGKFTKIYVGTTRKFADKTATPGETYYYKVKAYTDDKGSSASDLASYVYKVAAPTIKSNLKITSTSIKLEWSKVKGADGYKIYRKANDGDKWVLIKTVKSGDTTSYTNKNLNGKYIYAIRAYHKDGAATINGPLSASVKVRTLDKVKTVKVTTDKDAYTNTIKWSKVTGATGYQLYAKVAGGEWEHIVTTESGIRSFSHLVSANTIHYYKVRAIYGTSVAEFSDTAKSDINIIPNFTVTLPGKKINKPEYITVKIKNNTKKDMTIYAAGASYAYGEDTYTLVMSKSTKENFVENVKIPSGKTITVYMFPYDYVDSYRTDGAVGFLVETNNDIFVIAASALYGTQAYYYGSTK